MKSREGNAYSSSSGFSGRASAQSRRFLVNMRRSTPANGRPGRLVDRLIQRGDRQRLPQQLDETRRLPVPDEPLPDASQCAGPSSDTPHVHERGAIAPVDALPPDDAGEQVQRRRQRRTSEARRTAVSIDHVDVQVGLHVHVRGGVDATEKAERLVIAADQHVLPVVDALAGRRIGEGGRPPPSVGRASSTRTRTPRSASAVAALRPAKPPPITTTSPLNARFPRPKAQASMLDARISGLWHGTAATHAEERPQPDAKSDQRARSGGARGCAR